MESGAAQLVMKLLRGEFVAAGLPPVPPSTYSWLFPPKLDFSEINKRAENGDFPSIQGLAPAIMFSLLFGVMRKLLHHTFFEVSRMVRNVGPSPHASMNHHSNPPSLPHSLNHSYQPLATYAMKLEPLAPTDEKNEEIESGLCLPSTDTRYTMSQIVHNYKKIDKAALNRQVKAFSGKKYTEGEVNEYIYRRRRLVQRQRKIIKFVEALWRFLFYAAFCIMGVSTLFFPEPVSWMPWLGDTKQFWNGWPMQKMGVGMMLYYQVELGSYLHQLMWTEVSRSDAKEMIVHHLTTILLIGLSYVTNYTRVGVTIMLLHDMADVFLESAKVFNYSSKAKGHEWAKTVCDVLFATFALTFFVTRLIVYPFFVIRSVLVEAPVFFSVNWLGFWLFSSLLVVLQGLHVFWFYLIARMLYKLFTSGIEKDERSDDDDDDEEEEGESRGEGASRGKQDETSRRGRTFSSGKISGVSSPARKTKQS